jgi:hypothetical protein
MQISGTLTRHGQKQGSQTFLGRYNIPKRGKYIPNYCKLYQIATKYTKLRKICTPNGHKIYQHLTLQDPPKFTQSGIFGWEICHLATLGRKKIDVLVERLKEG